MTQSNHGNSEGWQVNPGESPAAPGLKWRVVLEVDPETEDWAVWCPELPGCVSAGETEAEALDNIREAIALYLEPSSIDLAAGAIVREVLVG